jgi:hypothetical protein
MDSPSNSYRKSMPAYKLFYFSYQFIFLSSENYIDSSDSDEDRDGMLVVDDASNNEEDDVEMKVSDNTEYSLYREYRVTRILLLFFKINFLF